MVWLWIIVGLVYLLSRIDLIPDVVFPWGWIDDGIVLMLIYRRLARMARSGRADPGGGFDRAQRPEQEGRGDSAAGSASAGAPDPYRVLGLKPPSSPQEIRATYLKLANQYHPDKVAHLGREFQELAEKRFKEIQEAYQRLTDAH